MPCCAFEDFKQGVFRAFAEAGCPSSLIDWKRARRDWIRHHCTGWEAASMQLRDLDREAEYNYDLREPRHD